MRRAGDDARARFGRQADETALREARHCAVDDIAWVVDLLKVDPFRHGSVSVSVVTNGNGPSAGPMGFHFTADREARSIRHQTWRKSDRQKR
jgi:hypothetical protein